MPIYSDISHVHLFRGSLLLRTVYITGAPGEGFLVTTRAGARRVTGVVSRMFRDDGGYEYNSRYSGVLYVREPAPSSITFNINIPQTPTLAALINQIQNQVVRVLVSNPTAELVHIGITQEETLFELPPAPPSRRRRLAPRRRGGTRAKLQSIIHGLTEHWDPQHATKLKKLLFLTPGGELSFLCAMFASRDPGYMKRLERKTNIEVNHTYI